MEENPTTDPLDFQNPFETAQSTEEPVLQDDTQDTIAEDTTKGEDVQTEQPDEPAVVDEAAEKVVAFDKDLDAWAEKTGRSIPTTDEERASLQSVRDGQREYTREQQAKKASKDFDKTAKELRDGVEKSDDDYIDPLEKKVAQLEKANADEKSTRLKSEFYQENKIDDTVGEMMVTIFKEKVERTSAENRLKVIDHWDSPDQLSDLHELALARIAKENSSKVGEQAARQERERIERESKAAGINRNAKTQTEKPAVDPLEELWKT